MISPYMPSKTNNDKRRNSLSYIRHSIHGRKEKGKKITMIRIHHATFQLNLTEWRREKEKERERLVFFHEPTCFTNPKNKNIMKLKDKVQSPFQWEQNISGNVLHCEPMRLERK